MAAKWRMLSHTSQPIGWYCTRDHHVTGPCALRPTWWNLAARLRGF